ncbi:Pumilio homolog 23-like protein [Drosera capensis]
MVSVGLRALPRRRPKQRSAAEDILLPWQDSTLDKHQLGKRMGRKATKKGSRSEGSHSARAGHVSMPNKDIKDQKFPDKQDSSFPQTSFVRYPIGETCRKQLDPETVKYFSEITNLLESGEVDLEERPVICGNALEETRGKEVELAFDHIISHTLQKLLEGCDAHHLCGFLQSCASNFARIATDRCGSHVVETAIKSLAMHLQDSSYFSLIEETLTSICKAIVAKPVEVMCDRYASHVLRSLLCLCQGVSSDSEFLAARSSSVFIKKLNAKGRKGAVEGLQYDHEGFPDLFKFLVTEMLKNGESNIAVLQTALKLLAGQDQDVLSIIPVMLGCKVESSDKGNFIQSTEVQNIRDLVKENSFSHLMEVILEVAPKILYDEIFEEVFSGSLFELASHLSANFVVQALISQAKSQSQMDKIWEELHPKFKDLLEAGRSGVIASMIAASNRLHTHEQKCSEALAAAVSSTNESPKSIVPRILFLESYLFRVDKSNWCWASNCRMHVMGSLILQWIFKYPSECIQPFISSITSMESAHLLETATDSCGSRVLEAFLSSNASDKQKHKLIAKLKNHFGELSIHPSGSFTIEKCFNVGDVSLREAIVSELLSVQKELSKTKQGPLLLRNLDAEVYERSPDQWRSRQKSKLSVYKDFLAEFSEEPCPFMKKSFLPDNPKKVTQQSNLKKMREEIDASLTSFVAPESGKGKNKRVDSASSKKERKRNKGNNDSSARDKVDAGNEKKRRRKGDSANSSQKKLKT